MKKEVLLDCPEETYTLSIVLAKSNNENEHLTVRYYSALKVM